MPGSLKQSHTVAFASRVMCAILTEPYVLHCHSPHSRSWYHLDVPLNSTSYGAVNYGSTSMSRNSFALASKYCSQHLVETPSICFLPKVLYQYKTLTLWRTRITCISATLRSPVTEQGKQQQYASTFNQTSLEQHPYLKHYVSAALYNSIQPDLTRAASIPQMQRISCPAQPQSIKPHSNSIHTSNTTYQLLSITAFSQTSLARLPYLKCNVSAALHSLNQSNLTRTASIPQTLRVSCSV
jgi:hypothetical protein